MAKLIMEKQIINFPTWYSPQAGCFGKINKNGQSWDVDIYRCREDFHKFCRKLNYMAFVLNKHTCLQYVAAFIDRIETVTGVRHETVFAPTNRNNVVWLNVSPWWSEQSMRRNVFTAFLRASQNYIPVRDNFEEALWSCNYLDRSRDAVKRFLRGYTWYTGRVCGWYRQFAHVESSERLNQLLIKPEKMNSRLSI